MNNGQNYIHILGLTYVRSYYSSILLPVQTSNRLFYNYVKDAPLTSTFYTWEKDELLWRSDV